MHSQLPELEADKVCCFKLLNLWTHYIVSNNSTNISERHHAVWSGAFWIGYEMSPEVRVWTFGPKMVALFWEAVDLLGAGPCCRRSLGVGFEGHSPLT